jgi:hypothetical protein
VPYDNFDVQSGDLLSLKVTAKSKTAGSTSVYNHRTGQKKETHYDNQPSLCLDYAEWIVESEFVEEHGIVGGELTANFTPIHFEQSSYRTSGMTTTTTHILSLSLSSLLLAHRRLTQCLCKKAPEADSVTQITRRSWSEQMICSTWCRTATRPSQWRLSTARETSSWTLCSRLAGILGSKAGEWARRKIDSRLSWEGGVARLLWPTESNLLQMTLQLVFASTASRKAAVTR